MAAFATVPEGYYWGFTYAQLIAEKEKYVAAVAKAGGTGNIVAMSENGKSVSFASGSVSGGRTLEQWGIDIRRALAYVSDDVNDFINPPASTATASFRCFR